MLTNNSNKKYKYFCENCNLNTNNKKDFEKHLLTSKHTKLTDLSTSNLENETDLKCSYCKKVYKSRVGLWKHKKICKEISNDNLISTKNTENLSNQITPEFILSILEQNKDVLEQNKELSNLVIEQNKELSNLVIEQNKTIMELAKNGQGNTIANNNINSHNKTFNLQFFLNETCKDAMNITDFVDSLKLQLSDLENVGKVGFVEGISSIIVKNLKALDVHKRPVHCADKKREIIYIKDEDKWEKEDEKKNKMRKVIKKVAFKNQNLLKKFKEEHPGCNFSESKYSDQYSKIVIEAMGGFNCNDTENEDKIIQKIAKEIVIDKKFECIE